MIKSIDGTTISAFCVHECEGSSRMGSRPRRFLFTGHTNGGIQVKVYGLQWRGLEFKPKSGYTLLYSLLLALSNAAESGFNLKRGAKLPDKRVLLYNIYIFEARL